MKSVTVKITFVLAIVLCNGSFGLCQEIPDKTENYNFVKLVENSAKRFSLSKVDFVQNSDLDSLFGHLFINQTINPALLNLLISISPKKCVNDVLYMFENVKYFGWAAKMIDSYGRPESGILAGNMKWAGDYRECINIYAAPKPNNASVGDFHGAYCSLETNVTLIQNITFPFTLGVCLPDSCVSAGMDLDLRALIGLGSSLDFEAASLLKDLKLTCPPTKRLTSGAIAVICIISIFALLALIGSSITAYESFSREKVQKDLICASEVNDKSSQINDAMEQQIVRDTEVLIVNKVTKIELPVWLQRIKPYFNCFCFFSNGEKLLNTDSSEGQLPSLHGIRFLSMSWVILCHTYAFSFQSIRNPSEAVYVLDHWHFQIILNGFYSVDSFFLLSGFLVAYLFFQEAEKKNGKIPWTYFYIHRYIRLTPVYMMVMAFYTTMLQYLGSGPFWKAYDDDKNCKESWWWNILYINNFQGVNEQCMGWAWYLANDMQFYIISPLFLITLRRWPLKVGYWLAAIFLCISFVANFVLTYEYNLFTGLGDAMNELADFQTFSHKWTSFFNILYIKPYARISPYIIGIILAYYLFKNKENKPEKHSWFTLCSGWVIASVITMACLFGNYDYAPNLIEASFYNALNRTGFSVGLSWVIYVCLTGQGGFVNKFLSWKFLIPLSRLTFCAYLIHPVIQYAYYQSLKVLLDFNNLTLVVHYIAFIVMSYISAFFISLLFESPLIRLEKIVRTKFSS